MKKLKTIRTLGITALTACAVLAPLPAQASENASAAITFSDGKGKVYFNVLNGKNCNLSDILADFNLQDCPLPDYNLPNFNQPECNLPDFNLPEINFPGTPELKPDIPGTDAPDVNVPEQPAPDKPETEKPGTPDTDKPETDKPGTETPDNKPGNGTNKPETPGHSYLEQVVHLVNLERAKEGLAPLTLEADITDAAMVRAKEIQASFSHTRPNGSSFATALKEAGVSYRSAGENIAWGQKTPEIVVDAWMNSSGHRANIMNPNYSRIGVGYLTNASGTPYWVQLFAN